MSRLPALFCCHATCSVSMVLLNKTISQGFDFPWTVIFFQNVGTVLLGSIYARANAKLSAPPQPCKSPDADTRRNLSPGTGQRRTILGMTVPVQAKNRLWLVAQSAVFVGTLFTSLRALHFISVPLYVVARNSVPAVTSLLEYCVDGTAVSAIGLLGIVVTVLGTVIYTTMDQSVEFVGFSYAILQVLVVALASAVDKASVRIQSSEENIQPAEVNQIRVALSMPMNLLLIACFETVGGAAEPAAADEGPLFLQALMRASTAVWSCMVLSTVFGFGMGTFNFCLQKEVNATTVQVANITYKLLSTIISRATHPAPVPMIGWVGYSVSLFGIAIYTFGPKLVGPLQAQPPKGRAWQEADFPSSEEDADAASDVELLTKIGREESPPPRQKSEAWAQSPPRQSPPRQSQ